MGETTHTVIDIPGYRILRQLGHGGMATVYLAIQQSVDREVALKVMSPHLLTDPNFGERFLREARIAAKLRHRHVVGVHDVGKHADLHYIAMEYLTGGPILRKDGQPRDVPFALRVTREIATALAYAHSKGFIHRDVKPDNILLRDDGSSALTDFGIARASDSATRMTRTGAVIGTPHYMSPEQARGKPVDGRADLYSLGVVLYELLIGRVPFQAEDSLAVGIMHITEAPPALPERLSALQPMLDVMLAKRPEDRYQTGDEMAQAIRAYEVAMAEGQLPSLLVPTPEQRDQILSQVPAFTPQPPRATTDVKPIAPEPPTARNPAVPRDVERAPARRREEMGPAPGRNEPSLGDVSSMVAQDAPRRGRAREQSSGWGWGRVFAVLLVLGGIGGAAWHYQDRIRALLPNTELNSLLAQADEAFRQGQLVGTSGVSALELYRQVQKQDADNAAALAGIRDVGHRLAQEARTAVAAGDLVKARERLGHARDILQGGQTIEQVELELRSAEGRSSNVTLLLEQAIAASAAGKLLGTEDSAAAYYQRVLTIDSSNGVAAKGLEDIVAGLQQQVKTAIAAKQYDAAEAAIADIERVRPGHASVPQLRGQVGDAKLALAQSIEQWLTRGEEQLRAGDLIVPPGNNAEQSFRKVLNLQPGNERARAGLSKIGAALLVQIDAAIEQSDLSAATRLLTRATGLGAPTAETNAARVRVRELRERLEIAAKETPITPDQAVRIEKFLADADTALARGDLNEPPGGNAYDLYRAALALDRKNARANAGLAALPARAKELFEKALVDARPNTARSYLDAFRDTSTDTATKADMTTRLARAFLSLGIKQVAEGQTAQASKSLIKARELSPGEPGIAELAARIQAAGGG